MKRCILLLVIFLLTHKLIGFEGLYLGAGGGISATKGRQQGDVTSFVITGSGNNIFSSPDLSTDILGGCGAGVFYAGYGRHCGIFYGGIEGFVHYANSHTKATRENLNTLTDEPGSFNTVDRSDIKIGPWGGGIDGRPGLLLSPGTLLYGRVGFNYTQVKLNSEILNFGFRMSNAPWSIPIADSKRTNRCYLRLGGGLEQLLSNRLALRFDYVYTDYGSISFAGNTTATLPASTVSVFLSESKKVNLRNHELVLGLTYYFSSCYPTCFCKNASRCSQCCCNNFCGLYLAGSLGGALTNCRPRGDIVNFGESGTLYNDVLPIQIASHITHTDFRGNLFAGYGRQYKRFYAGLEVFAQYFSYSRSKVDDHFFSIPIGSIVNVTALNSVVTHTEIDPWQFGIQARPGLLLTPCTLIYGTIGTSGARIKARSDATTIYPDALALSIPLSARSTRATLRAGGGIEQALRCGWHIRADYLYTNYGSLKMSGSTAGTSDATGPAALTDSTKIKFADHAITLGLSWYL